MALITLSLAAAMMAGGFLKGISWALVFGISACFQLCAVALCLFLTEIKADDKPERQTLAAHVRQTVGFIKSNHATRALMAGIAIYSGVVSTYYMFAQELLSDMGFTVAIVSGLFAVESLLSAGLSATAHVVEANSGARRVLLAAIGVSAVLFPLVALNHHLADVLSFLILSLIYSLFQPIASSVVNSEMPSDQRASLLSVMSFACSLVMFLIFPLAGHMADRFGAQRVWAPCGASAMVLSLVCCLRFYSAVVRSSNTAFPVPPPVE